MGTSVSQASPRTGQNWKPVFKCYENERLPVNRIINEVWRASEKEDIPISSFLKSNTIYNCFEAVKNSNNFSEALQKFNQSVLKTKSNSVIAEFAKRVIPIAFQSEQPTAQWTNCFFTEVTNYIVSRDSSGFVGEKYRNKSVNEMIEFKRNISLKVNQLISSESKQIETRAAWNSFVDRAILKLKSNFK